MTERSDFAAFRKRYLKNSGFSLTPWERLLEHLLERGASPALAVPRTGRRELTRLITAFWEATGRRWDVVGASREEERRIRREARELAARLLGDPE